MARNLGATSLKRKAQTQNPMQDYDRLPKELRAWIASAVLPWRARSVLTAYTNALSRMGDPERALRELDRLQSALIAKDTQKIWGADHPEATAPAPHV